MAIIDFGGTKEKVITRKEFPMPRHASAQERDIAIIGYGVQGRHRAELPTTVSRSSSPGQGVQADWIAP